jgi:TRAP transporter TAXI family solute receptor
MKKTKMFWTGLTMAVLLMLSSQTVVFAGAQKEEKSEGLNGPVHVTFSAQGLGTSGNTQANAFAAIFSPVLPSGSTFDLLTNSSGSLASPFAIEGGLGDLTMAESTSCYWASHEPGLLGRPLTKKVRAIAGGLTDGISIIVMTQDFVRTSGCKTLDDVVAKKYPVNFAAKQAGSMGNMVAVSVLAQYGVTFKDIESWGGTVTLTDSSNIVDMMKDSKADMCIDQTTPVQPNWTELAMTTPIAITVPSEKVLASLKNQGFADTVIPKGSYNNAVKEDTRTVGAVGVLACSSELSDDLVYLLTKTACENKDKLVSFFAGFADWDPEKDWQPSACGVALHPGAERYYRERGWMK